MWILKKNCEFEKGVRVWKRDDNDDRDRIRRWDEDDNG
jgi:hypothetical protein